MEEVIYGISQSIRVLGSLDHVGFSNVNFGFFFFKAVVCSRVSKAKKAVIVTEPGPEMIADWSDLITV